MAEPASTAPSVGYLKHAIEAGRVTVICWLVLYLFDFFLTVSTERRHVWKTRWTPLKFFYFLNRYVTLAAITGNAILVLSRFSSDTCSKICWIQPVLCTLAVTLCAIIAALRVHTISNRSRIILFLLGLPLLIMSGLIIGLSTQVKPFVIPSSLADQVKFSGCIAVQSRKRTFLVIWILPLIFDFLVLVLTFGRSVALRRKSGVTNAVHVLMRIVNKHLLYFSIIFACNALNVGFFIFADPSLKSINVPATVALTSILTNRLVLSLFSTNSTSPVICPSRRPSSSSSNSRRGGTWSESHSKLPSRSATSGSRAGVASSSSEKGGAGSEEDEKRTISSSEEEDRDEAVRRKNDASSSRKQPSISSRSSIRTSSSAAAGSTSNTSSSGSGSRRRRSQDLRQLQQPPQHVIVPVVPDLSRYNYHSSSHRHSHSSSSSIGGGVLRPLLLANSLVPPSSNVVTQPLQPHPNPTMSRVPPPTPASLMPSIDSTIVTIGTSSGGALQLPGIEPSTPLTFSAAFFTQTQSQPQPHSRGPSTRTYSEGEQDQEERKSVQSPLNSAQVPSRRQPKFSRELHQEEEQARSEGELEYSEEEEEEEEFGSTGDLGEMTRENREKLKKLRAQEGGGIGPTSVPIESVFSSSDDGATNHPIRAGPSNPGGGGVRKVPDRSSSQSSSSEESIEAASSSSSNGSKRSSTQSLGSHAGGGERPRSISRNSLRYFTEQFPNPNDIVTRQAGTSLREGEEKRGEDGTTTVSVVCE